MVEGKFVQLYEWGCPTPGFLRIDDLEVVDGAPFTMIGLVISSPWLDPDIEEIFVALSGAAWLSHGHEGAAKALARNTLGVPLSDCQSTPVNRYIPDETNLFVAKQVRYFVRWVPVPNTSIR